MQSACRQDPEEHTGRCSGHGLATAGMPLHTTYLRLCTQNMLPYLQGILQEKDGEQEQAVALAQSLRHNLQLLQEAVAEKVVDTKVGSKCCTKDLYIKS